MSTPETPLTPIVPVSEERNLLTKEEAAPAAGSCCGGSACGTGN